MGSSSPWKTGPSNSPESQQKRATEGTRDGSRAETDSQTFGIAPSDLSLTELLRLAHDGIIVANIDGMIQFWNRGAEEMYGWSAAEACGNLAAEFLRTEFPQRRAEVTKKLFELGAWQGELVQRMRDGRRIAVASRQVLRRDEEGKPSGILEINRDITFQKEAQISLQRLSVRLLQLQDEERRRIARELHDSTGQSLAALVIHLSAINGRIGTLDPTSAEILCEAMKLSQQASDEIRTLSYLLHPPTLDLAGLTSALKWLVDGFMQRSKLQVELEISTDLGRLHQNLETALFRIVQESLTNIFRHSGSPTATIRLSRSDGNVNLEVSDRGSGIPPNTLATLNGTGGELGVGIRGMRERVRQLGGNLELISGSEGTTVTVRLPIGDQAQSPASHSPGAAST
ncbi:MAG TPA: ATP-binding protein [Candidatus Dormibacteraeota bacterium]|nr:ATP-binding protein [Candidatus Dormibacteraeota bacterium]